ncbi:response regulator transcription factor [Paenibacillus alba]|uniref:Response regulator n=1 Tax=Paenibacillus alba TaxID=1197127 RepID=A0ABU6GFC5_9BACL|nr:helix-turn-helix domain-containing protein [Paenibacillus alba]MEC0231897.1 response regulator [Paenibacillus alba]
MNRKALIVDDEIYAVMGIRSGLNWDDLQISDVYEAYNIREAMKVFEHTHIDILICDIEMPKGTGIELLEWVNVHSPATETIFLTAHADFGFVQRAVQLDSFDYMLKPIEFSLLQATVAKALQSIQQEQALHQLREQYKPYYELWLKNKSVLTDTFWNQLFAKRIGCKQENAASFIADHHLPLTPQSRIVPIVISVESWERDLNSGDEEVMEYALRKAASEVLLEGNKGEVIQTKQGVNVVLFFLEQEEQMDYTDLNEKSTTYIASCKQYFSCSISCYIGEASSLCDIRETYIKLLDMEYNNLQKSNKVYWQQDYQVTAMTLKLPEFSAWTILIEQGKRGEMEKEIHRSLMELREDPRHGAQALQAFYHGFLQMIHYILHKNGLSAHELLQNQQDMLNGKLPRSLEQLQAWALQLISVVSDCLHQNDSVIQRVQCFIADHLSEMITREQLADFVHLNPAYLSRLFKKEVGESITDYILLERMKLARELIRNSSIPISDIAKSLGYSNFSYFAKMFKKVYHHTPQHYRKQMAPLCE